MEVRSFKILGKLFEQRAVVGVRCFNVIKIPVQKLGEQEWLDVLKICVAGFRVLIPLIHRIDCLGQLDAAGRVDTERVDPDNLYPSRAASSQ